MKALNPDTGNQAAHDSKKIIEGQQEGHRRSARRS
jgi:hypothetical protein